MPELSQFLLDHGASLEAKDRENFTLLMQAVLSMDEPADRERMVKWLLSEGVDPNAKNDRGETAYQLAARMGFASTLELLVKAGAKEVKEEWPTPAGGAPDARAAVKKVLPFLETSGEAVEYFRRWLHPLGGRELARRFAQLETRLDKKLTEHGEAIAAILSAIRQLMGKSSTH